MKKIRLHPFVFNVKGAKNYAFYDLLNCRLFVAEPEGDVEEVKKFLVEKELAIDSESVIPFKFENDISEYKKKVILRELQIRITGQCDAGCEDCGTPCLCFKGDEEISKDTLEKIFEQVQHIKVQEVVITGGNPFLRPDVLKTIKDGIKADKYKILHRVAVDAEERRRLERSGFEVITDHRFIPRITAENMKVDALSFFITRNSIPAGEIWWLSMSMVTSNPACGRKLSWEIRLSIMSGI